MCANCLSAEQSCLFGEPILAADLRLICVCLGSELDGHGSSGLPTLSPCQYAHKSISNKLP